VPPHPRRYYREFSLGTHDADDLSSNSFSLRAKAGTSSTLCTSAILEGAPSKLRLGGSFDPARTHASAEGAIVSAYDVARSALLDRDPRPPPKPSFMSL